MKPTKRLMVKRSRTKSQGLKKHRAGLAENRRIHQMCPIDASFKHFLASKAKEFHQRRKLSSIM
jgi:hypothetical protein